MKKTTPFPHNLKVDRVSAVNPRGKGARNPPPPPKGLKFHILSTENSRKVLPLTLRHKFQNFTGMFLPGNFSEFATAVSQTIHIRHFSHQRHGWKFLERISLRGDWTQIFQFWHFQKPHRQSLGSLFWRGEGVKHIFQVFSKQSPSAYP